MRISALKRGLPVLIAGVVLAFAGCQPLSPARRDLCPAALRAIVAPGQSGIEWGGSKAPKVEASIVQVAVQCFPVEYHARGSGTSVGAPFNGYQIAATASVAYRVHNSKWLQGLILGLSGTVIFEAMSANGVVLATKQGEVRIVPGGDSGTASATLSGLSGSEIQRVALVQARWRYGR